MMKTDKKKAHFRVISMWFWKVQKRAVLRVWLKVILRPIRVQGEYKEIGRAGRTVSAVKAGEQKYLFFEFKHLSNTFH